MTMSEFRPNFGLQGDDQKACKHCKSVAYNEAGAAHCMAGIADGSSADEGQRVNENFGCDNFNSK